MANIGYIRITPQNKTSCKQLDTVALDIIFTEECSTKDKNRPELEKCINALSSGDVLHVQSIDRLARNMTELNEIIDYLVKNNVSVYFHKEDILISPDKKEELNLILKLLNSFANFETAIKKERQKEGIEKAKSKGIHGRPRKISEQDKIDILNALNNGTRPAVLAKKYNVAVSSIYGVVGGNLQPCVLICLFFLFRFVSLQQNIN